MTNDDEIYHESMINAYNLLTNKKSLDQLIDRSYENGSISGFPFNPTIKVVNDDVYDKIIEYFCELEEYEKCQEILDIKNKNK